MKAVFVRPNYPTYLVTPPLGIGYLSACAKAAGIESVIIDGVKTEMKEEKLIAKIEAQNPDWVCITCLSAYFEEVKSVSLKLKEKGFKVVIGGVHPTFMPYMTLVETKADYVICGEGEKIITEFLLQGNNDGIKGVYSLKDLQDENTPYEKAERIEDLNEIPFPDWESLQPQTYPHAPMGMVAKAYPLAVMISSRGCPHGCIYCAGGRFYDRKVRFRSAENVVEEMKLLKYKYGIKEIQFMDDNLILKREHAVNLCNLILKEKLDIIWSCPNGIRADSLDYELACLMRKAGCYLVTIGIESANPEILKKIHKGETIEAITSAIYAAHRAGLIINGAFCLSLPGDTKETMRETIDYAKKVPLDRAFFTIMDVIPGCELWQKHKEKYSKFQTETSFAKPTVIPEGMTEEEVIKIQEQAMHEFYFRPRIMYNIVKLMRPCQFKYIFSRLTKFRLITSLIDFFTNKNDF